MGIYVNPTDGSTKEQWLAKHGEQIARPSWPPPQGRAIVCLVDNRIFTAAGVCDTERELRAFTGPTDHRPKKWFTVPCAALADPVSGLDDYDRDLFAKLAQQAA